MGANGARRFYNYQDNLRTAMATYFGKSQLGDFSVTDLTSFSNAVAQLRTNASADIKLSLGTSTSTFIPWSSWVGGSKGMESLNSAPEDGDAATAFQKWKALGIEILTCAKVTCRSTSTNFDFSTFDNSTIAYWAERWELYRWFYASGRWLADNGITQTEILNEPELEPCIQVSNAVTTNGQLIWQTHYLIRSQALLDAYADHNALVPASSVTVNIWGAPFAAWQSYAVDAAQYGTKMIQDNFLLFPQYTFTSAVRKIASVYVSSLFFLTIQQQNENIIFLTFSHTLTHVSSCNAVHITSTDLLDMI